MLLSFLDNEENFVVHFFEGQKLLHDLAVLHGIGRNNFEFYRDAILSFIPLVSLLKKDEGFGLFIDSEDPYFRLKIEAGFTGHVRSLLLPEKFEDDPKTISGVCRVVKLVGNKDPYTTVVELNQTPVKEIINKVLTQSYQIDSQIITSSTSDQSIMLMKLPEYSSRNIALPTHPKTSKEYLLFRQAKIQEIFAANITSEQDLVESMTALGLKFLTAKPILFYCPCSKERMVANIFMISNASPAELFEPGSDSLEVTCEYCHSKYEIFREELLTPEQ